MACRTDGLGHPFGLDVSGGRVYWTDWDTKSAMSADKFTGKSVSTVIANTSDLMDIRVFHRTRRRVYNACDKQNGGCSHLCLLNPTSFTCACAVGVQLKEDRRTCSEGPTKYILFAHRIDIRQISLDFDHLIDVVLPLPPISNAVALDVDQKTGYIFWSDTIENVIMSSSADGLHVHKVIGESLENPDGLVVDSIGRMIYWADAGRHTIEVATLDGNNRHVIAYKDLESPRGLALDYEAGLLFWTDWGHYRKIERSHLDGNERSRIVTANLGWPNGLSLDLKSKRIYWVDALRKTIDSCDYTGNQRKLIMSALHHPYALALSDDHIYWTDWKSKALHMADRRQTSNKRDVMTNIDGLMDIKVIIKQPQLAENVCGRNNGGCSHLCLRNPAGYSCQCPTGLKLRENSTTECQNLPDVSPSNCHYPHFTPHVSPPPHLGLSADRATLRHWHDLAEQRRLHGRGAAHQWGPWRRCAGLSLPQQLALLRGRQYGRHTSGQSVEPHREQGGGQHGSVDAQWHRS